MSWMLGRDIVVLDLETTEVAVAQAAGGLPQMVEIGAVRLAGEDLSFVDKFESLVRPANVDAFTPFCEQLTGITRGQIEAAPVWADVWRVFAEFTGYRGCWVASWGSDFDFPILRRAYAAARVGYPHRQTCLDVRSVAFALSVEHGLDLRCLSSLTEAHRKFDGPDHGPKHRALPDAMSAAFVLRKVFEFSTESDRYEGVIAV